MESVTSTASILRAAGTETIAATSTLVGHAPTEQGSNVARDATGQ